MHKISEDVLRHIMRRHGYDIRKTLRILTLEELKRIIIDTINNPSEVYQDVHNPDVRYYLKRLGDLWLNVVVRGNEVKTAYLIGAKSYKRFKTRRWTW